MLEGAALIGGLDLQIPLSIAGDFARAELIESGVHLLFAHLRCLAEIDLIALDSPAADVGRVVWLEVAEGGKWLHFTQQRGVHADGAGDGVVIEKMC